jgi:photosystem II stability/assembly factor-like uncharacterized protein
MRALLKPAAILLALLLAAPASALEQRSTFLPAVRTQLARQSLMLAVATAGDRLIAVGAHGLILLSDDFGVSWRQARDVPTQATLTAVTFLDAKRGFAVGHDAVVLKTDDGGENWSMRYVDIDRGGPLLTVAFLDDKHGLAMGGFGLVLETTDGGWRWRERLLRRTDVDVVSLNKILVAGDQIYVASDSGVVYRSGRDAASFVAVQAPTTASFWSALALPDGWLLFCGAGGEVWRARRDLTGWEAVDTPKSAGFTGMTLTLDGRLALAGLGGVLAIGPADGDALRPAQGPGRGDWAALTAGPRGKLVLLGEHGVVLTSDKP